MHVRSNSGGGPAEKSRLSPPPVAREARPSPLGEPHVASATLTTRQRGILEVFQKANGPLTPQEVWELGRADLPGVGLATVYRAIRKLVETGQLRQVEIADSLPRYECAAKPHHHHFRCVQCGRIVEIPKCPPRLDDLVPRGFKLLDHSIILYGLCDQCMAASA
ncbi:MAG: transcriptional repressor [Candidatus Sumerlaeia bacterium]|nr:transcriptional repressor [Candidatus Sumerlaeia bacterium]